VNSPGSMVATEERINVCFNFAADIMSSSWELAAVAADVALFHRSCPWGGHLIKLDIRNVLIEDAPENASEVLVRPEVRGQSHDRGYGECRIDWLKTLAPGDALVEETSTMWILRLGALLFGDFLPGPCLNEFFYHPEPVTSRHQLRRDFPEKGDCCYGIFQNHHGVGQEILKICRSEGVRDRFRSIIVFSTPKDQWAHWASPFFSLLTSKAKTAIEQFLNRPGVRAMRSVDTNFYVVLSLRGFSRGPPLLPELDASEGHAHSIKISTGKHLGISSWSRFQGRFHLAEYLEQFLEKLGFRVQTFPNLDGRSLVSYQCVMLRGQWEDAKDVFQPVFNLHRAAYRHANGGTAAPSLNADVRPRFLSSENAPSQIEGVLRVVVRKTFLELDEESIGSQLRRTKSEPSWSQAEGQDFV